MRFISYAPSRPMGKWGFLYFLRDMNAPRPLSVNVTLRILATCSDQTFSSKL